MLSDTPALSPISQVAIIVPIREGDAIMESFNSMLHAISFVGIDVSVTAVGDGCLVRTLDVVRDYPRVRVVEDQAFDTHPERTPRAIATRFAMACTTAPADVTWIVNTRSNFIVPQNWLVDQIALADQGADVVIGGVEGMDAGWPCGANLGIRASSYFAAGGYRAPTTGADADLVARLSPITRIVSDRNNMVVAADGPYGYGDLTRYRAVALAR